MTVVDCALLVPLIHQWKTEGGRSSHLSSADARFIRLVTTGEQKTTSLDRVDRLLIALDLSPDLLNEIAPLGAVA